MTYAHDEIEGFVQQAATDWSSLYTAKCVNYRGDTKKLKKSDISERDTEVVARWILAHYNDYARGIRKIERKGAVDGKSRRPYFTPDHENLRKDRVATASEYRSEELIAQKLYIAKASDRWEIGEIVDYQTPLKDSDKDSAGKIDLLSYFGEQNQILILELKKEGSKETLLRCILEAYTYYKTIKDKAAFVRSFESIDADCRSFAICPLFFENSQADKDFNSKPEWLKALVDRMKKEANLDVRFFRIEKPLVEPEVKKWRIKEVSWNAANEMKESNGDARLRA